MSSTGMGVGEGVGLGVGVGVGLGKGIMNVGLTNVGNTMGGWVGMTMMGGRMVGKMTWASSRLASPVEFPAGTPLSANAWNGMPNARHPTITKSISVVCRIGRKP